MKKTILRAMLFFALLFVGLQNASAQYVTNDDATVILNTEVQTILDNPNYTNPSSKGATFQYLYNKVTFYTVVKEQIAAGSTVEVAIQEGVMRTNTTVSSTSGAWVTATQAKLPSLTSLHQEIIGLLSL
jgi:hypothetical protein